MTNHGHDDLDRDEPTENGGFGGGPVVRVVLAALITATLLVITFLAWPRPEAALAKIAFDLTALDDEGLHGPEGARVPRDYEFCIPDNDQTVAEARSIDRTLQLSRAPGRVGCTAGQLLAIGNTHQSGWLEVLTRLARLPYIRRIEAHYGE